MSFAALAACSDGGTGGAADAVALETLEQRSSYAIGMAQARQLDEVGFELDRAAFEAAFDDFESGDQRMTDEQMSAAMTELGERARAEAEAEAQAEREANRAAGEAYLAENAARDGVTVTESGLQYRMLEKGDGATPGADDRVSVHYTGRLIDGTVFDSSMERGTPATFGVTQVIRGWTEMLQLMQVGDKVEVTIPSELAYGEAGRPSIPPNSVLVFEVELLDIET